MKSSGRKPKIESAHPPVNRICEEIGRRLRARRNELGLTQTQLAAMLGLSQQQVVKYESGENRIAADQLFKILDSLNFKVSLLYETLDTIAVEPTGFAEDSPAVAMLDAFSRRDTATLVRTYLSIPEGPFRKQALDFVKAVADNAQPAQATGTRGTEHA